MLGAVQGVQGRQMQRLYIDKIIIMDYIIHDQINQENAARKSAERSHNRKPLTGNSKFLKFLQNLAYGNVSSQKYQGRKNKSGAEIFSLGRYFINTSAIFYELLSDSESLLTSNGGFIMILDSAMILLKSMQLLQEDLDVNFDELNKSIDALDSVIKRKLKQSFEASLKRLGCEDSLLGPNPSNRR